MPNRWTDLNFWAGALEFRLIGGVTTVREHGIHTSVSGGLCLASIWQTTDAVDAALWTAV